VTQIKGRLALGQLPLEPSPTTSTSLLPVSECRTAHCSQAASGEPSELLGFIALSLLRPFCHWHDCHLLRVCRAHLQARTASSLLVLFTILRRFQKCSRNSSPVDSLHLFFVSVNLVTVSTHIFTYSCFSIQVIQDQSHPNSPLLRPSKSVSKFPPSDSYDFHCQAKEPRRRLRGNMGFNGGGISWLDGSCESGLPLSFSVFFFNPLFFHSLQIGLGGFLSVLPFVAKRLFLPPCKDALRCILQVPFNSASTCVVGCLLYDLILQVYLLLFYWSHADHPHVLCQFQRPEIRKDFQVPVPAKHDSDSVDAV
jgi:hypothetical protein